MIERGKEMDTWASEEGRKTARLREVSEKWQPYMDQLGGSFPQAVDGLMQTEHTLRTGTPQQKQAMLLKLASDYGVSF